MRIFIIYILLLSPCLSVHARETPADAETETCFIKAGAYHQIDPTWLRAIAKAESRFNPKIVSPRNKNGTFDIGMMQINSGWFPTLAKFGIQPGHLTDACTNIFVGAWILSKNIKQHGRTWEAIGAYNTGNVVKKRSASMQYALKVRKAWEELNKLALQQRVTLTYNEVQP